MNPRALFLLSLILLGTALYYLVAISTELPAHVATTWGANDEPVGYMSAEGFFRYYLALSLGMNLLFWIVLGTLDRVPLRWMNMPYRERWMSLPNGVPLFRERSRMVILLSLVFANTMLLWGLQLVVQEALPERVSFRMPIGGSVLFILGLTAGLMVLLFVYMRPPNPPNS